MTQIPPAMPVQFPPSHQPPRRRTTWKPVVAAVVALAAGIGIGAASAGGNTKIKQVAGPTTYATTTATATVRVTTTPTRVIATQTRTATVTYTPTYDKYGEGLYVVGKDIQPGMYHTAGSPMCYWARLSSLDTSAIIDNNVGDGPQTVQIMPSDKAFQVRGDCTFGPA